ncbi:MAG TPA: 3-deoxy-D-manno-octulosonic acid transferase, partial [Flavobacterium sp.]|nr:3-deoxy-D-manno-octulosonic acid transferase [Flavobacterium sp.]
MLIAYFIPKIRLFINGRKFVFETLKQKIKPLDQTIWFHAASLGEFEQGIPIIEQVKKIFPNHKIVLTFFSPSGFEVRKNNILAHATVYLPLDTKQNVTRFLDLVHPDIVFFIKYEFWPNYLNELKNRNISTYLISGIFRENQFFFKSYGGFYRIALATFNHFFVQNDSSKKLLQHIGFNNVTISGDTRFDRVTSILKQNNYLDFIEKFKNNILTIVVGSSWFKDEALIVNFINQSKANVKFIIAPHVVDPDQILKLQKSITKKTVLFSEKEATNLDLENYEVFIIDTIGILTKIYSYADIAYVGGGFGNPGVHNILEPATFGVPIVIGPNFNHFAEAVALVDTGGCLSISNQIELNTTFNTLISNN